MKKFLIYVILLISPSILIAANNIDSNNKYAWNKKFCWVMFQSDHSQVKINWLDKLQWRFI